MAQKKSTMLRLDIALHEQLVSASKTTGIPVQHMLREAVQTYIEGDLEALLGYHASRKVRKATT